MKTIAVINNERTIGEIVRFSLEQAGYRVRVYPRGLDALEVLVQEPPDLVMLDTYNPPLGGVALLRRLRQHCDTPVIFLSPHAEEVARELSGTPLAAHDYIESPFSVADMIQRVKAVIDR